MITIVIIATCAIIWRYGAYYGKVIDGETKKPLEGGAVLAVYYTEGGGFSGARSYYVDAQETLTDKNGEFKIPSNIIITFRFLHGWLDPQFQIFKPGYGCYPPPFRNTKNKLQTSVSFNTTGKNKIRS